VDLSLQVLYLQLVLFLLQALELKDLDLNQLEFLFLLELLCRLLVHLYLLVLHVLMESQLVDHDQREDL
jgi:hypothetical protein